MRRNLLDFLHKIRSEAEWHLNHGTGYPGDIASPQITLMLLDVVEGVAENWDNIHTHYGYTDSCRACNAFALLTQSQAYNA